MLVSVPLGRPPQVASLGVGSHGHPGRLHDRFRLPDLWAFHLYRYAARLTLDGEPYDVAPGRVSLVPPGTITEYRYRGVSEHLYVHLRLTGTATVSVMPPVVDAGRAVAELTDLMLGAITSFVRSPEQATSYVWAALWRVATLAQTGADDPARTKITPVLAHIESRLAQPLPVAELAAIAAVSPTHLTRLFRQVTGETVVGYVRRRRLAQAEHLLRNTTLPVASVARSVGIGDLQAFNKACRVELGASPRAVRTSSGGGVGTVTGG